MKIVVGIKCPPASEDPSEVTLRLDAEGIDALMKQLLSLKEKRTDHIHLMSPSWGMECGGLTEDRLDDSYLVHHLKILEEH